MHPGARENFALRPVSGVRASMKFSSLPELSAQVYALLNERQKLDLLWALFVSLIAALFTVVGVASIAPFFAVLADPSIIEREAALAWLEQTLALPSQREFFAALGFGFVILLCIANLANFLSLVVIGRFAQNFGASLHTRLFEEYIYRDLPFHKGTNGSILETQVVHEVSRVVEGVIRHGLMMIAGIFSVTLIVCTVLIFDPAVAVGVLIVLGSCYLIAYRMVRRKLFRNGTNMTRLWRARSRRVSESFDAIRELILLDGRSRAVTEVAADSQKIARANASSSALAVSPRYIIECVTAIVMVIAALSIYGRSDGSQWMTQLAFLSFVAYRLLPALQQIFAGMARMRTDGGVLGDIAVNLARTPRTRADVVDGNGGKDFIGCPREEIVLDDVSYRHSAERVGGVDDISLRIPAGAVIGLVGPSGSGKTTLVELILGLLEPDKGEIRIDGVRLEPGNRRSWFAAVAYVPQRIVLLHGTLSENIAFGIAQDDIDHERLADAVERAQLKGFVDSLPDGLATDIGEDGMQLSGGERQRIGIARALYRRASVLVLDEATNALDAASEALILGLIAKLRGQCTTIIVSHHARAVNDCEFLIRLENGIVADVESVARPGGRMRTGEKEQQAGR